MDYIETTPKNVLQVKRCQYNQKYYNSKKEIILGKLREKVECPVCKCMINKSGLWKHQFTKKHIKNLQPKISFNNTISF